MIIMVGVCSIFNSINYRHASNSNVEIHAENRIQMYVAKEQTAKSKTTNLFAHVQEVTKLMNTFHFEKIDFIQTLILMKIAIVDIKIFL